VTLGEGSTPLIDLSGALSGALGVRRVLLKAEDRNPTGSFKARIASLAYSIVRERGWHGAVGTSSGNGGAAAAAYAAAAGSRAIMFTLSDTVPMKLAEIRAYGGDAFRVTGVGHDAASTTAVAQQLARVAAAHDYYPMLTGYSFAPEAMTAVQTIAWEIADLEPEIDAVYAPIGGGGLITGLGRGFATSESSPRIVGVHPAGANAIDAALHGDDAGMAGPVTTSISGLQMAVLYDPVGARESITSSSGHAVAVTDADIWSAQRLLASHGILVEPAGATCVAGMLADSRAGLLGANDTIVGVLTGAGYKDSAAIERMIPHDPVPEIDPATIGAVLTEVLT
jgi:threonine synthase